MAAGDYERLLAWSKRTGRPLKVDTGSRDGRTRWSIYTTVVTPVSFSAAGHGWTTDEAAAEVIERLDAVKAFE